MRRHSIIRRLVTSLVVWGGISSVAGGAFPLRAAGDSRDKIDDEKKRVYICGDLKVDHAIYGIGNNIIPEFIAACNAAAFGSSDVEDLKTFLAKAYRTPGSQHSDLWRDAQQRLSKPMQKNGEKHR